MNRQQILNGLNRREKKQGKQKKVKKQEKVIEIDIAKMTKEVISKEIKNKHGIDLSFADYTKAELITIYETGLVS